MCGKASQMCLASGVPTALTCVCCDQHTYILVDQPGGVNPAFALLCTLYSALSLGRGFPPIHVHRGLS
jgi:hypothetical protein